MMDRKKVEKLIAKLRVLAEDLMRYRELVVHQHVDHWYYLQKIEELQMLVIRLEEIAGRKELFAQSLGDTYREVFWRWQRDVRWLGCFRKGRGNNN